MAEEDKLLPERGIKAVTAERNGYEKDYKGVWKNYHTEGENNNRGGEGRDE